MYKIRNKMVKKTKKITFLPNCLRILIFLCNFAPNFLGAIAQHANATYYNSKIHKIQNVTRIRFFLYFFIFP